MPDDINTQENPVTAATTEQAPPPDNTSSDSGNISPIQKPPESEPVVLEPPIGDIGQAPAPTNVGNPPSSGTSVPTEPILSSSPIQAVPPPPSVPVVTAPESKGNRFVENMRNWRQLLQKATASHVKGKEDAINKVFILAKSKKIITRREVQILLRCRQATAGAYIKALEKQGKLRALEPVYSPKQKYEIIE